MTTFMLFLSRSSRRAADSFLFYCFQWLYSRIPFTVYLELLLNILKSVVSLPSESKTAHSHYKEICETQDYLGNGEYSGHDCLFLPSQANLEVALFCPVLEGFWHRYRTFVFVMILIHTQSKNIMYNTLFKVLIFALFSCFWRNAYFCPHICARIRPEYLPFFF